MKYIIPILVTILFSCSTIEEKKSGSQADDKSPESTPDPSQMNDEFQVFLDKFPKLDLPVVIKGCEADESRLIFFNEENPSLYTENYAFAYGQFQSNGPYISVITLGAADCLLPVITTYKLSGEVIDRKTIAIGYCGESPCFDCEEFMTLKEDYSIYTVDTIRTSECDEQYNPVPGTESTEIIYKEGQLTESGKIELSKEIKKKLSE